MPPFFVSSRSTRQSFGDSCLSSRLLFELSGHAASAAGSTDCSWGTSPRAGADPGGTIRGRASGLTTRLTTRWSSYCPAVSPVLLGSGQHLFGGINTLTLGYRCTKHVSTAHAMHVILAK